MDVITIDSVTLKKDSPTSYRIITSKGVCYLDSNDLKNLAAMIRMVDLIGTR